MLSVSSEADARQLSNNISDGDTLTYACLARGYVNAGSPEISHLLGGKVAKKSPTATAFPWRNLYGTVRCMYFCVSAHIVHHPFCMPDETILAVLRRTTLAKQPFPWLAIYPD